MTDNNNIIKKSSWNPVPFEFAGISLPVRRLDTTLIAHALNGDSLWAEPPGTEDEQTILFVPLSDHSIINTIVSSLLPNIQRIYQSQGKYFFPASGRLVKNSACKRRKSLVDRMLRYNFPYLNTQDRQELRDLITRPAAAHAIAHPMAATIPEAVLCYWHNAAAYWMDLTPLITPSEDTPQTTTPQRLLAFFRFHAGGLGPAGTDAPHFEAPVSASIRAKKIREDESDLSERPEKAAEFLMEYSNAVGPDEVLPLADNELEIGTSSRESQLTKKIQKQIDELKMNGFDQLLLQLVLESFGKERLQQLLLPTPAAISPLTISRHFKIMLPSFAGQELKLTALPKTVFLFFLRHPEGILFKHLPDYRQELLELYQQVYPSGEPRKMERSIEDLTNPYGNSIHEKCSRIKGTLVKMMTPALAQHYYVRSGKGALKYIPISRYSRLTPEQNTPDRPLAPVSAKDSLIVWE